MRHALPVLLALSMIPFGAVADDAIYVPTASLLPALPGGDTGEEFRCDGSNRCVDRVIRKMTKRWRKLDRRCDHDAVFALTYLLTTIEYRRAVEDPAFFSDNAFVNNEDRVFADYYFDAFDDWHHGDRADVPEAWRIAFEAAEQGTVSGSGDLLLGMNAHIQRDLPYVLEEIGRVAPDGSSRKHDHDKVNEILDRVTETVLREAAARYDPSIDDADVPGTTLDRTAFNQLVQGWRETAWRHAELLDSAPALLRPLVVAEIEANALAEAQAIRAATAFPPGEDSTARDAYCAGEAAPPPEDDGLCVWVEAHGDASLHLFGLSVDTWLAAQARGCFE